MFVAVHVFIMCNVHVSALILAQVMLARAVSAFRAKCNNASSLAGEGMVKRGRDGEENGEFVALSVADIDLSTMTAKDGFS